MKGFELCFLCSVYFFSIFVQPVLLIYSNNTKIGISGEYWCDRRSRFLNKSSFFFARIQSLIFALSEYSPKPACMDVNRKVQTLDEFTIQQMRDFPNATGELSLGAWRASALGTLTITVWRSDSRLFSIHANSPVSSRILVHPSSLTTTSTG